MSGRQEGRLHWLDHEFHELVDPARYLSDPRTSYQRLKRVNQLSRRKMSAAREFAAWREQRAAKADIPRKWVVTDEQIVEACKRETRSVDQLFMVRGLRDRLSNGRRAPGGEADHQGPGCPRGRMAHLEPQEPQRAERRHGGGSDVRACASTRA